MPGSQVLASLPAPAGVRQAGILLLFAGSLVTST
jgi:hypothetical protein